MHELALFAGAGGGILGSKLLGWNTRCAVEIDPFCRSVLLARQKDGALPRFPIWDDIRTFDGRPWQGSIDVVTGGFPCQDISSAGKGVGITGDRSSLFFEMLRVIGEIRPTFVFAENSPDLRTRGLGVVVEGLSRLGYVGAIGVLGAGHLGAPHKRNRMWIVATHLERAELWEQQGRCSGEGWGGPSESSNDGQESDVADTNVFRRQGRKTKSPLDKETPFTEQPKREDWWSVEPNVGRVAHGLADGVDRIKALGNGQVPIVAATAWKILAPLAIEMAKENQSNEKTK